MMLLLLLMIVIMIMLLLLDNGNDRRPMKDLFAGLRERLAPESTYLLSF